MTPQQVIFIGYQTLEGLAQVLERACPVQASAISVAVSSDGSPIETRQLVVMVSQVAAPIVRYCRFTTGYVQFMGGEPWGPDYTARQKACLEAYGLVVAWLQEQGFTVEDATVSHPRDMTLVEGTIGFLTYDPERTTWVRRKETAD